MTPLELLHRKLIEADEAGVISTLIRNCTRAVLFLLAVAAFVVIMFLVTNALYWLIGGWGIAIGAIVTLGVLVGALVTAFEVS